MIALMWILLSCLHKVDQLSHALNKIGHPSG